MAFYDRLKEGRVKAGLTQEQLAEKLGIAKSTLSGYESGNREPTVATIAKALEILNIDANFLYQDETNALGGSPMQLQYDEMRHIEKYRRLPDRDRELVDQHMDRALEVADQADQLQTENQQLQEALASREEPAESEETPNHLTVIAAHNDHATEPGQLELMRQDVERAKKLIAERKKK